MSSPWEDDSEAPVEGVARVVALDGEIAWLEPEPVASCGGCVSLATCGSKGGFGRGLATRRFPLEGNHHLRVGERVVVGLASGSVLRASATAYGVPLATMIGAGILAQLCGAGDGVGASAILGGLGLGLVIAHVLARRLSALGELSPRLLRRVAPGGDCSRG
jgi:sigma-E factor negative regulatory protein RseC